MDVELAGINNQVKDQTSCTTGNFNACFVLGTINRAVAVKLLTSTTIVSHSFITIKVDANHTNTVPVTGV